jgi:hypothetical protein
MGEDDSISEVLIAFQFYDDIVDLEMNCPNNMVFGEKVRIMVNEYKKQLSDE